MGFIGAGGLSSGSPIFGGGSPFLPFGPGAGGGGGLMSDPILRAAMAGAYWGGELAGGATEEKAASLPTAAGFGVLYYMMRGLPGIAPLPNKVQVPFSSLDIGVQPEQFRGFFEEARGLAPGTSKLLKLSLTVDAGSYATGTSTLNLEGTLARDLSGNISFGGFVTSTILISQALPTGLVDDFPAANSGLNSLASGQ